MGTQKNCLNETVLLSTKNICLKLWVRKYLQFYAENFVSSKLVKTASMNNLCSRILNTFSLSFLKKKVGDQEMLVRIENREDPDQTALFICLCSFARQLNLWFLH